MEEEKPFGDYKPFSSRPTKESVLKCPTCKKPFIQASERDPYTFKPTCNHMGENVLLCIGGGKPKTTG